MPPFHGGDHGFESRMRYHCFISHMNATHDTLIGHNELAFLFAQSDLYKATHPKSCDRSLSIDQAKKHDLPLDNVDRMGYHNQR